MPRKKKKADAPKHIVEPENTQDETKTTTPDETPLATKKTSRFGFLGKIKDWKTRYKVLGAFGVVLLLFAILFAVPTTRYAALNTIGDADATLTVLNATTDQPVKGANVQLSNGDATTTDDDGVAFFNDTDYGTTQATITKSSYDAVVVDVTISEDNIDLGEFSINPIGIPVHVEAVDWLTMNEIKDFVITSEDGESSFEAVDGAATINVPVEASGELVFMASGDGYNEASLTIATQDINRNPSSDADTTRTTVQLVADGRHHFVSDRDGKIGFYSSNYDGGDVQKLVETDKDGDHFEFYSIPDSDNNYVALVSSKNERYQQDQLALIKPEQGTFEIVDEAAGQDLDFDIRSTDDDKVVYSLRYDDARPDRYKIKTLDVATQKLSTVYESEQWIRSVYVQEFDDVYIHENIGSSAGSLSPGFSRKLIKINLSTNERTVLLNDANIGHFYIHQSEPDKLFYSASFAYYSDTGPGFYLMDLADSTKVEFLGTDFPDFEEPEETPDTEKGQASPNETNRVWIDSRDGKQRLVLNETSNAIEGEVANLSVFSIIRWTSETQLTVTGNDGSENADYIVDVDTGSYRKITNSYRRSHYYGH